jgi:protein gp37
VHPERAAAGVRPSGTNLCYAGRMTAFYGGTIPGYARNFDVVEMAPGRMAAAAKWKGLSGTDRPDKPWLDRLPRLIFVRDMSDVFSRDVSFAYLKEEVVRHCMSEYGQRLAKTVARSQGAVSSCGKSGNRTLIAQSWPELGS